MKRCAAVLCQGAHWPMPTHHNHRVPSHQTVVKAPSSRHNVFLSPWSFHDDSPAMDGRVTNALLGVPANALPAKARSEGSLGLSRPLLCVLHGLAGLCSRPPCHSLPCVPVSQRRWCPISIQRYSRLCLHVRWRRVCRSNPGRGSRPPLGRPAMTGRGEACKGTTAACVVLDDYVGLLTNAHP